LWMAFGFFFRTRIKQIERMISFEHESSTFFEHELHELYEWFYVDDNLDKIALLKQRFLICWKCIENTFS